MKVKKKAVALVGIGVILLTASILIISPKNPPIEEIETARILLSEATRQRAKEFAPQEFSMAKEGYEKAMALWGEENEKFILFRRFDSLKTSASESAKYSRQAIESAKKRVNSSKVGLGIRIEALKKKGEEFNMYFANFPMSSSDRNELVRCRLLMNEMERAYHAEDYIGCKLKLEQAENITDRLYLKYMNQLEEYFANYQDWSEMIKQAMDHSRKNGSVFLVVDKMARSCLLYKGADLKGEYPVELGPNWIGDKMQQGDRRTPEGRYKVVKKLSNGSTTFYKALLLDYPNEQDKQRFRENVRTGRIDPDAGIGSLIEIHGGGGRGVDWTNGCVALKNSDMDIVYRSCSIGTPVIIVGSILALDQLNRKEDEKHQ